MLNKSKELNNMETKIIKGVWTYYGDGYSFTFKDESIHRHTTTIIKNSHIKVLENKTDLSLSELKTQIVDAWFADENAMTRENNNAKARARRRNNER